MILSVRWKVDYQDPKILSVRWKVDELTSIGLHDSDSTNDYWVLVVDKKGTVRERKTGTKLLYHLPMNEIC